MNAKKDDERNDDGRGPAPTGRQPAHRVFSYDEALAVFPAVRDLTASAVAQVEALAVADARRQEIEQVRDRIVAEWVREITAIGCEVKGLWLVDWDNGDGYYCWKFPEESIGYFHGYEDGFAGRMPVN